jgi:hypothetical protein
MSFLVACGERKIEQKVTNPAVKSVPKLQKVTFYLENSESMFGYVNGLTEYVQVISELSSKSDFISNGVQKEFVFINGKSPLSINSLGDISSNLNSVLTPAGYRKGNTSSSELNEMLKLAMQNAGNGKISVFISDGIFDINQKAQFSKFLTLESGVTKVNFINKLSKSSSFQTLLIKLNSQFDGKYFFASQNRVQKINQKRPYYIWVFGDSQVVNQYFSESFINNSLVGRTDYLRFIKLGSSNVQYGISKVINQKGKFDVERNNPHSIENAEKDPRGSFSFSFAVDLSSIPFSESYFTNKSNYSLSNNYQISSIQRIRPAQKAFLPIINNFKPTHIITLICKPQTSHLGGIDLQLKYVLPNWINKSSPTPEVVDSSSTFGFDKLTSGIAEAYNVHNQNKNLAEFKFQINR